MNNGEERVPLTGESLTKTLEDNYKELGYAIIEQALNDYRELEQEGLITRGRVRKKDWPSFGPYKSMSELHKFFWSRKKVVELVNFFQPDLLDSLLDVLCPESQKLSGPDIRRKLIIKERKKRGCTNISST